jgi:hypothetical protein
MRLKVGGDRRKEDALEVTELTSPLEDMKIIDETVAQFLEGSVNICVRKMKIKAKMACFLHFIKNMHYKIHEKLA